MPFFTSAITFTDFLVALGSCVTAWKKFRGRPSVVIVSCNSCSGGTDFPLGNLLPFVFDDRGEKILVHAE